MRVSFSHFPAFHFPGSSPPEISELPDLKYAKPRLVQFKRLRNVRGYDKVDTYLCVVNASGDAFTFEFGANLTGVSSSSEGITAMRYGIALSYPWIFLSRLSWIRRGFTYPGFHLSGVRLS